MFVYIVCEAEYESNGPVAAFFSAEVAEKHVAALKAERGNVLDYEVRALPVYDWQPRKFPRHRGNGHLRSDGDVTYRGYESEPLWEYEIADDPEIHVTEHDDGFIHVVVAATTPERAKAAFDAAIEQAKIRRAS